MADQENDVLQDVQNYIDDDINGDIDDNDVDDEALQAWAAREAFDQRSKNIICVVNVLFILTLNPLYLCVNQTTCSPRGVDFLDTLLQALGMIQCGLAVGRMFQKYHDLANANAPLGDWIEAAIEVVVQFMATGLHTVVLGKPVIRSLRWKDAPRSVVVKTQRMAIGNSTECKSV